jgi:polyisoprenoid-binding protein YceI
MRKPILLITLALLFFSSSVFGTLFQNWDLTEDYTIKFSTKKAEGTMQGLRGTVIFDPDDPESASFDVTVDVSTIDTGNDAKTRHAKNKSWFHAEAHPTIRFTSGRVMRQGDQFLTTGQLTIKGITKTVEIPFSFSPNEEGGLFEGSLTVKRADYELDGPFLLGGLVGDEVEISLRVPVNN